MNKQCIAFFSLSLVCALTSAIFIGSGSAYAREYFVSPVGNNEQAFDSPECGNAATPFKTIERARDQIRFDKLNNRPGPWTVTMAEGEYPILEPIVFSTEDSGTESEPILYRGAGATTILSGGIEITGWHLDKDGSAGDSSADGNSTNDGSKGDCWVADLPIFDGQPLYFEQMFVDNSRAVRARYPNEGFLRAAGIKEQYPMDPKTRRPTQPSTEQYLTAKPGDLDLLNSIPVEEYKWSQMIIHHNWDTTRRILLSFDKQTNTMTFKGGPMKSWNPWRTSSLYYMENLRSAFDQPGEWFYDGQAKKVYYRPLEGQQLGQCRFFVPRPGLIQLIRVEGKSATEFVHDLRFENMTFYYSDTPRRKPVMANAELDQQVTGNLDQPGPSQFEPAQAASFTLATVMVDEAKRIAFDHCVFSHLGEYGLWFRNASRCSFVNSTLSDLGAGGLRLGGGRAHESFGNVTGCDNNTIDNCYIQNGGRFHASAVGVWIGNNTTDNALTHCDIGDFYYTGVSVGWNWGYAGVCFRNRVEFNRIHDIGQGALADMGGVYTLGTLTGTRVCNNVIYNVRSFGYGGWGLYPDEGSEGLTMENNLVYDTMDGSFHQHYGRNNVVRNNIFARNLANPMKSGPAHQVAITRIEPHRSVIFENNIIYWTHGTSLGYNFDRADTVIRSNLWWNAGGEVDFRGQTHAQWESSGKDAGGLVADPMFVAPEENDFRLKPGSPAEKIGFKPFDYTQAGVQQ